MDKCYLGIDTSNYTTSVCIYNATQNKIHSKRKLLEVGEGKLGLRQSEAVFQHNKNLPDLILDVNLEYIGEIVAYGASDKPRNKEKSYMPCFKVGSGLAKTLGIVSKTPYYYFTHQQGHIASALFSINKMNMINDRFISFHVSGGTTDAILCDNKKELLCCEQIGTSLDLHAGQLIDRVGLMLGLKFPCGKGLEELALECNEEMQILPTMKGNDCCLSGFENKANELLIKGYSKNYIAKYTLMAVAETLYSMLIPINKKYGRIPILFTGGVMSNTIIREFINKWVYSPLLFSDPDFATDNAVGIAVLTSIKDLLYGNTKNFNGFTT